MRYLITLLFLFSAAVVNAEDKVFEATKTFERPSWLDSGDVGEVVGSGFVTTDYLSDPQLRTFTCAGFVVSLIPATEYATERFEWIYGTGLYGSASLKSMGKLKGLVIDSDDYREYRKNQFDQRCDVDGRFHFTDVPAGEYFAQTQVLWKPAPDPLLDLIEGSVKGGLLWSKVSVKKNKTTRVVLAP